MNSAGAFKLNQRGNTAKGVFLREIASASYLRPLYKTYSMRTDLNKTVRGNAVVDSLWNFGILALVLILAFLLYKRGKLDGFLPAEYASTKYFPREIVIGQPPLRTVPDEPAAPESFQETPAAEEPIVEPTAEDSPVTPTEPQGEASPEATSEAAPEATSEVTPEVTSEATPEAVTEAAPAQ